MANEVVIEEQREPVAFIGLGASAGGLAALQHFFDHTPQDSGAAFIVVMHLSTEHESHLAELLQAHTEMTVLQVSEDQKINPNTVYVIPPGRNLSAIDTHLRLSALEPERRSRAPIDHFFRTLSDIHQEQAVAVVLSGSGSDGAVGLSLVKERGGLAVAQDPTEAEYDSMPQSAIMTGLVDTVLPVREMPDKIIAYVTNRPNVFVPEVDAPLPQTENVLLQKVFAQLRAQTNHDFSGYKRATVMRRIARRMQLRGVNELSAYLELLRHTPQELDTLFADLLISVTNFFRDPDAFGILERDAISQLFENKRPSDQVRVWVVGCATGEEAYGLAMLLLEYAAGLGNPPEIQVFATDVAVDALVRAREGLYPGAIAADVSDERLKRFFVKEGESYRVKKELRERVLFAPHNVLSDPPFSKIDLLTCRNVLIYIRQEVQTEVLRLFHYALREDGLLLLGTSESADDTELFLEVDKKAHLFRRRNVAPSERRLPNLPYAQPSPLTAAPTSQPARSRDGYGALHQQLVERYAPPSVLINNAYNTVHLSESAGRFLQNPGGEPTHDLLKRVRPELRADLRSLLYNLSETQRVASSGPVALSLEGSAREVTLRVSRSPDKDHEALILVVFDEQAPRTAAPNDLPGEVDRENHTIRQLEDELEATKRQLQSVVEEYESSREEMQASNEELQSINEELRSTAEELETSKEELQSINEELITLNQENKHKVEELSQLTSDLQNLFAATDVATLFLDRETRIKRFTPKVGELFNILPSDVGRPLTHLTHKLGKGDFVDDAQDVLRTLIPITREVRNDAGAWYLMRLHPYRTAEDRIDGVVLTFIEIDQLKRSEEELRQSEARYRAIVSQSVAGIGVYEPDDTITFANTTLCRLLGYTEDALLSLQLPDIVHPDDLPTSRQQLESLWANHAPFTLERRYVRQDGSVFWVHDSVAPLYDNAGQPRAVVTVTVDITRRHKAELELKALNETLEQRISERTQSLQHSERRFSQAFNAGPVAACITSLGQETFLEVNEAFLQLTGYERTEVIGRSSRELKMWSSPEDRARLGETPKDAQGFRNLELQLHDKAGELHDILISGEVIRLDGHEGYLKMFYDVTQRKRNEGELHKALQDVISDTSWFSHKVLERLANIRSGGAEQNMVELSRRERQILEQLARGRNNEQIAQELGIAAQTVRNYISNVYDKLGVHSRGEAIVWARERGITG